MGVLRVFIGGVSFLGVGEMSECRGNFRSKPCKEERLWGQLRIRMIECLLSTRKDATGKPPGRI